MANIRNFYVLAGSDYKINWIIAGQTFILTTVESIGWSVERESETIHAVGQEEPIATKRNNAKYSGSLNLQAGEIETILQTLQYPEPTVISNSVLAVTVISTENAFSGLNRTFQGLNVISENLDIKNKDKNTVTALKWEAIKMINPLASAALA